MVMTASWPSYAMVFGVPAPKSKMRKKEYGYFRFQRKVARRGKPAVGWEIYLDKNELEVMLEGIQAIIAVSRGERMEEWIDHDERKERGMV